MPKLDTSSIERMSVMTPPKSDCVSACTIVGSAARQQTRSTRRGPGAVMDELLADAGTAGDYAPQERDAPCGVLVIISA